MACDQRRRGALHTAQPLVLQKLSDHGAIKAITAFGRSPTFLVKHGSNRRTLEPLVVQLCNPLQQLGIIAQLFEPSDGTIEHGVGAMPTDPMDLQFHFFRFTLHSDDHALDQLADNRLTIRIRGARSVPQGWNILCQLPDGGLLLGRSSCRLLRLKTGILGLQCDFIG